MNKYLDFALSKLAPAANQILEQKYNDYCSGKDIGIETKADSSPASSADKEAELALRKLINEQYPNHGICGEEFGTEGLDRDYVWVLDPLDGTQEFLNKKTGCFVVLIGLLYKKKQFMGISSDPISKQIWNNEPKSDDKEVAFSKATIACTNPDLMFKNTKYEGSFNKLISKTGKLETNMNATGFTALINGNIDITVENDLGLHDIAALIPILANSGCSIIDLDGNNYKDMVFDFSKNKYNMIAARNDNFAKQALSYFKIGEK